jgi:hypothetical protein
MKYNRIKLVERLYDNCEYAECIIPTSTTTKFKKYPILNVFVYKHPKTDSNEVFITIKNDNNYTIKVNSRKFILHFRDTFIILRLDSYLHGAYTFDEMTERYNKNELSEVVYNSNSRGYPDLTRCKIYTTEDVIKRNGWEKDLKYRINK